VETELEGKTGEGEIKAERRGNDEYSKKGTFLGV